ncbi:MAG: lipid II flippase MurJ [Thermoanaerobaculia bacterium]
MSPGEAAATERAPTPHGPPAILRAFLAVGTAAVLAKAFAAGKDLFVASRYGVSEELDVFLAALLIPFFLVSVVAGSFAAVAVPAYLGALRAGGPEEGVRLVRLLAGRLLIALAAAAAILLLASGPLVTLVASGFSPEKREITRRCLVALTLLVPIAGLGSLWSAILNARGRFALPALLPSTTSVVTVLALLLSGSTGAWVLVLATLAGAGAEGLVLILALRRHRIPSAPLWRGTHVSVAPTLRQGWHLVGGSSILATTVVVDQSMAAMLGPGSVASLAYGSRLVAAISSLGAMALGTAALPTLAAHAADCDWAALRATVRSVSRACLAVSIPVTVILIVLSRGIVAVWFERGAFTAATGDTVASVQRLLLIQVPFFLVGIFYARLLAALGASRALLWGNCLSVLLNVGLNLALMRRFGVPGIALSTSIVYVVALLYLRHMANRRIAACERGQGS